MRETEKERAQLLHMKALICAEDTSNCIQELRDAFIRDGEEYGVESTMEVIRSFTPEEVVEIETTFCSVIRKMNDLKDEIRDLFHESRQELF